MKSISKILLVKLRFYYRIPFSKDLTSCGDVESNPGPISGIAGLQASANANVTIPSIGTNVPTILTFYFRNSGGTDNQWTISFTGGGTVGSFQTRLNANDEFQSSIYLGTRTGALNISHTRNSGPDGFRYSYILSDAPPTSDSIPNPLPVSVLGPVTVSNNPLPISGSVSISGQPIDIFSSTPISVSVNNVPIPVINPPGVPLEIVGDPTNPIVPNPLPVSGSVAISTNPLPVSGTVNILPNPLPVTIPSTAPLNVVVDNTPLPVSVSSSVPISIGSVDILPPVQIP